MAFSTLYDNAGTIHLVGELDIGSVSRLRAALDVVDSDTLVIDASRLCFIDASGLGELIRFAAGCHLRVINPSKNAARLFTLVRLDHLLAA